MLITLTLSILGCQVQGQQVAAHRVFVNLDKSMVPCNQELQYMLEDEMIELSLLKTLWSNITSESRLQPTLSVSRNGGTNSQPNYMVNINGLMNNSILFDGDNMVGTAAWLNYPISIHDLTKMNFTLNWRQAQCNLNYNSLINCSPQGGFALVFQQESTKALGEFKNNLGQGLGYDGLSGIFAIEFDTQAITHKNLDSQNQLRISMQVRNKNIKLLSSSTSSTFKSNSKPVNFASFNLSGFSQQIQVQLGIITNQLNQQIMIVLDMNGMRQLEVKTSYEELGLDSTRSFYVGFTSAQNLNRQSPSATLDIQNFRLFKGKPKFVDGQVSYIGDSVGPKGNQSNLEIRSSFYDLCMQKTTLVVYPTVSEFDWINSQETEPHIIPFFNNRDTMIVGSIIYNINKPQFYSPSSLTISPDVKFQVSLPTGVTTNVRMGFYYYNDLIMNITAIDYFKRTNSNYTFLVIKDSDLITSTLTTKGYANNLYQFDVFYYDGQLNPVAIEFSKLQISVTSDYIRLNNTIYNNQVPMTCYSVGNSQNPQSLINSNTPVSAVSSSQYTCQFLPNVNGTYYVNSPFLPSGRSFKLEIGQADQVNEILSSEYSQAIIMGNFEVDAGSTIEVFIDLRNNLNNTYVPQTQEGCVFTNSYYFLNGNKYSFLFYDQYPYLRTVITQAGVADFKISISCTRQNFDLQCFRCQKVVKPLSNYLYYRFTIPTYPSSFETQLSQNIMVKAGSSFVIDVTFYDRYDNIVPTELDNATFNTFNASFVYGTRKAFQMQKIQVPGKLYMFLNDSDNLLATQLRARTNLYYLNLQTPGSSQCFSTQSETRRIYFVPQDKNAPMDFIGDGDEARPNQFTGSVYWDQIVSAGEIGKFSFTLRNANMQQMNTWIPLNDTRQIDPRIQDGNARSVLNTDCRIRITYGLYEGEYLGFFICNSAPRYYLINLLINGTNITQPLPIYVRPGEISQSNIQQIIPISAVGGNVQTLTLGSGGLNVTIRLADSQNNSIDKSLVQRDQLQLGLITYNLTQLSTGNVVKYEVLPMVNPALGTYRLHIDNVPVGRYRLQINMPGPSLFQEFNFNSSSTVLSAQYSFAYLDNPTQSFLNNYVMIRFFARNIHNQSITDLALANLITQQTQMYLQCSQTGQIINFTMNGTFPSQDGIYYNFTSQEIVRSNGVYSIIVYFREQRQYMHVRDGFFTIFDNYDPLQSDIYMVKGMDQREYRLAPFNTSSQLSNQYNATYYDPRFDGTLRFKFYLRTSTNNELVTNPRHTPNQVFTGAYLSTATYVGTSFSMGQNLTNINLKIVNFTNTFMIVPVDQADQDRIEQLQEGYYFIYLAGTNFGNRYTLQWLFSLFNSDIGQQNTANPPAFQLLGPRFINMTAGEPFTFIATAMGGTPSITSLTVLYLSASDLYVEIESTSRLLPAQNHFYVTLYQARAGIYSIQLQATYQRGSFSNPPKEIIIQVNPAPFYQMNLLNTNQLTARVNYLIGTKISFNFTFVDRFGNSLFLFERNRPNIQEISEFIQLTHNNNMPIDMQILPIPRDQNIYQCTFTTFNSGIVTLIPGLQNYTAAQTIQQASMNVTFIANVNAIPSVKNTYAAIRLNHTYLLAGSNLLVDIYLEDEYGNDITSTQNRWWYLVNVIPDNTCNTTTHVMDFRLQRGNVITFIDSITIACTYNIRAFYFSLQEGKVDIPCINCYLTVLPNAEDARHIGFLDSRDVIVDSLNRQNLYVNKQDMNPKFIITFRDQYNNLITNPMLSMNYTYQIDFVATTSESMRYKGYLTTYKQFHMLYFCETEQLNVPCFSAQGNGYTSRLRIIQLRGNQQISKIFINVNFVDNYGAIYNSDDLNQVSPKYSYLRILNQNLMKSIGFEQAILPDQCIGGDQYPIIGRIEVKTEMGFRRNDTFTNLQQKMSITLDGIEKEKYIYNFYSGNTVGMVYFTLYLKDDYFNDRKQATARIYIDDQEYTNQQISVQCRRRNNYQKFIIASNSSLITSFENSTIQAGSPLTFKVIAADPQWQDISRFRPYDDKLFFNYTTLLPVKYDFSRIQYDYNSSSIIYMIKFRQVGQVSMKGPYISDLSTFNIVIQPGNLSYQYSTVSTTAFRIRAGDNSSILINPMDEFGNQIDFTPNTTRSIEIFNSLSQVYIARIGFYQNEIWNQVQCFEILANRVRCSTPLTTKGIYKWRVIIGGQPALCQNCYIRVTPSGRYNHNKTVLTDLSQNYYANQQLAFSKFNVQTRLQGLFFKIFISDEYDNIYINEDHTPIDNITARITFSGIEPNLNVTKIHRSRTLTNTHVYSATIFTNNLVAFSSTIESYYRIQVIITNASVSQTAQFINYVKANRTSPSYPQVFSSTVLKMRFRETQFFTQTAGKYESIQFGLYDDNSILQPINTQVSQQFAFQVAARFNSTTFNGDYMLGPYKWIYERQLRIDRVNQTDIINQLFTQQYSITVQVFNPQVSVTQVQFTTFVFPNALSSINFDNNNMQFQAKDSWGNDIDFNYEPAFNLRLVQVRNYTQAQPPFTVPDYDYKMDYIQRRGFITLNHDPKDRLSQYMIIEGSTQRQIFNPFVNYINKGILDMDKSYFEILTQQTMTAGQNLQVKISLLDLYYQSINITSNQSALGNLSITIILDGQKTERKLNFASVRLNNTLTSSWYTMTLQVNQSGYHYIYVSYYNQSIQNRYGRGFQEWIFVNNDQETGNSSQPDMQWRVQLTSLHRNKLQDISNTNGTEYIFMQTSQPLFFVARICDRYGNAFESQSIYEFYNVFDLALQSRITNFGRNLVIDTQIIYNVILISINDQEKRDIFKSFLPSQFPLTNNAFYNSLNSFRIEVYSPGISQSLRQRFVYLIIQSDFQIDNYMSRNQTSNQELLTSQPIVSDDFVNGQIQLRMGKKSVFTVKVRNTDDRPYYTEQIQNFTINITNTTSQIVPNTTNPRNITNMTIQVPLNTVQMRVIPYSNPGFYRVYFFSDTLYQDTFLNTQVILKTQYKHQQQPIIYNTAMWVFPPTPPNFLNTIINTTFLAQNQVKFRPATKVQFNLTLRYNNMTYTNDLVSASNIRIYRKSSQEQVIGELFNKQTYSISVNLEGPQTNQFRIYYRDFNGALYPLTSPEVIYFEIMNTDRPLSMAFYNDESFLYPKLGMLPDYANIQNMTMNKVERYFKLKQAFDINKVKIVILPNMLGSTYIIGNEFRASILVVDNQTSRCLLESDYNVNSDLVVQVFRYDPISRVLGKISIDLPQITLVKNVVKQPTSYCTYYSNAVLESSNQLNSPGNYTLIATFMGKVASNITFEAQVSGIDFRKTTVGWYQQPSNGDQLIAEFNAYEEFNYLIYFKDVQGNFVSERQSFVKIQLNFDGQKLIEGTNYKYISRYDDRFKGYLITVQFFKAGSFKPEYYFNLQRAENIEVQNGPILFVVHEPQCIRVQPLSSSGVSLAIGQLFNFVFNCYDINGKLITETIKGVQTQAQFLNVDSNNQQTFGTIEALSNGIYRVSHKFYQEGRFTLKIYFNQLLIYSDSSINYRVQSEICKDIQGNIMFRCPNDPSICANSYYECQYIDTTNCPRSSQPFRCGDGKCVSSMSTQCCRLSDFNFPEYLWCPNTNQCFNTTTSTCPTINTTKPLFCNAQNKFVTHQYECCEDLKYNVSVTVQGNLTIQTRNMTKCTYEDKCVPQNSARYCFSPFKRNCTELFGLEYSYQCLNDGKCKRSQLECPSPRVCPTGYTQCPDSSCIQGVDKFNLCNPLQNCSRRLPDGSTVTFIRCVDGSCAKSYEECPSQITCMTNGQVVCPDGSCRNSAFECIQPLECTTDKPYKCPGQPTVCAASRNECPIPSSKSCGNTQALCADGECSDQCKPSSQYQIALTQNQPATSLSNLCVSLKMIQCPNLECRNSYYECSDTLYCPNPVNYTYAASPIICPGAQVCALDQELCSYSQCQSILNKQLVESQNQYDKITSTQVQLNTCYDGRCHLSNRLKQNVCMTPISCSYSYFKSGGFGEFCVSSTNLSISMSQLAIFNFDHKCSKNKFKCVTGECRNSLDDCPSQITCPSELPVQCRDGQCVKSKTQCRVVDQAIEKNLMKCAKDGLLLCTSDLVTCTTTLSKCPTRSTCPIGYIKCWDESCIDPEKDQCPKVIQTQQQSIVSTCQDKYAFSFHCFMDGSCRASLEDCPTQSVCPIDRPVKCMDGSCRASVQNCPQNLRCSTGFKFCPGEGACVKSTKQCGTPETCSSITPFKCEDGTCVGDISLCINGKYKVSHEIQQCIQDKDNYLCLNNRACVQDPSQCKSSEPCMGTSLVKAQQSNLCYTSRKDFSTELFVENNRNDCELNNLYTCSNGTCSEQPCQEWVACISEKTPYQCSNGQCVSDQRLCPSSINGCPSIKPIRCNYTGVCVQDQSQCYSNDYPDDQSNLNFAQSYCQQTFSLSTSCQFDGSCKQSPQDCSDSSSSTTNKCNGLYPNQMIPNSQCFVPQCPVGLPYKCNNGLCVQSQEDCPLYPFSIQDLSYCQKISNKTGLNLSIPCGNGQCVAYAEECLPFYDCSLNYKNGNLFRCNDGTCRQKPSDCPIKEQICPSHNPFMCQNGMCAASQLDCLRNDNGCPERAPFKCPYDGQCTTSLSLCVSPQNLMAQMFIYPNYIPEVTSTPLIAFYGITRSQCQKNGQFVCRIKGQVPYCVDRLTNCIDPYTGCSVVTPIRCGTRCVSDPANCTSTLTSCSDIGASICPTSLKCVATSTDLVTFNNAISNGALRVCESQNGCPDTSPFQCPNINRKSCSALPYTSYQQLQNQSCSTFERSSTLQIQSNIFNDCFNSDTPYSCADGSCATDLELCPTCIYYCSNYKRCVKSKSDCDFLTLTSSNQAFQPMLVQMQQQCPLSMPIRCILSGKCVANELDCMLENYVSINAQHNQTNLGSLIDDSCPFQSPIRCYNGKCVEMYEQCFSQVLSMIQPTYQNALNTPTKWGSQQLLYNSTCQVYCHDGSCRDRVENCPIIHGCYNLQRPYRCQNGQCARDQDHCISLYQSLQDISTTASTDVQLQCPQSLNENERYERCEDGVCRPMSFNQDTNTYVSSCLPYMGCPLNKPFHCSTGECVIDESSCAGSSKCPISKPFRCKNFDCVEKETNCERPFSTYPALQIDMTIDPFQNQMLNFAYTETGEILGKLEYISNSFSQLGDLSALQSMLLTHQRVQIYPVPDSILKLVSNIIPKTRIDYIQSYFPLDGNTTLPYYNTLLSPAIKIEMTNPNTQYNSKDYGYLYFKVDSGSFPKVLNLNQDVCLGYVINQKNILDGQAQWQCQSREIVKTNEGYLKFKVTQLGIYALIINPNPDYTSEEDCGFICQNHQMLLILELTLVGTSALVIYALCICCHSKDIQAKGRNKQKDSFIKDRSFIGRPSIANHLSYYSPALGAINNTTMFNSPDKFFNQEGNVQELDIDQLKDQLESLDPNDPPLMPGQYVFMLAQQHETQNRQIDVLKSQLQEFQSREMDNLALIKAIFEKNKILHAQIELKQELDAKDSLNNTKKSNRSKRPRKIKEDPSIMSEYNNIDAYLAQSMLGSRFQQHPHMIQPLLEGQASRATFQEFPGHNNLSVMNQINPNDNSRLSIPVKNYNKQEPLIVTESTKDLLQKNYQSTTKIDLLDTDKMSNMLIRDDSHRPSVDQTQQQDYTDYNRRLGELTDEIQLLEKIEEEKDEDQSLIRKNKRRNKDGASRPSQTKQKLESTVKTDMNSTADVRDSLTNVESGILSKTLHSIFPNKRKGQGGPIDTRAYNMVIGNESITGNVSGNIIKGKEIEPDVQQRYDEYVNSKDNDDEDISDNENNSYERLKEIEQMMKNTSPKKKKEKSPKKKKSN